MAELLPKPDFILFMDTQTLSSLGDLARDATVSIDDLPNPSPVLHSGAAVLALLVNTILWVYKPRGTTQYGRRKQSERRTVLEGSISERFFSIDRCGSSRPLT